MKYYRVKYGCDYRSYHTVKARNPKHAIRKCIRAFRRKYGLGLFEGIFRCDEIDIYECLNKEVKDEETKN